MNSIISLISTYILPFMIICIILCGIIKKVPVYEVFIEGAKDGLKTSVGIVPYLVAILVAIGMFRASGAIDNITEWLKIPLAYFHIPADVLPIMIVRSLSGSGNIAVFSDIVANNGANSFAAKLAAIMVGSSETTFYVLSVYFGAVGIKKLRYSLLAGLFADGMGIIMAVFVANILYHNMII